MSNGTSINAASGKGGPRPLSDAVRQRLKMLESDLAARRGDGFRNSMRFAVWGFTLAFSYRLKRFVDLVGSVCALTMLSPLLILIAAAVKLTSPGPVIFTQTRVGRFGQFFKFYKFRSMYRDAEQRKAALLSENESKNGVIFKMKKDPRITPVGRFLRKFSLDELPQFANVFLGDMSLVGPRPPVPNEVREYTLEDRKRLNVMPGITCLWQISGRSEIPFNEQVMLDKEYIQSRSFWSDFVILLKTVPAVLLGRGAY